jgi:hypothetical protein
MSEILEEQPHRAIMEGSPGIIPVEIVREIDSEFPSDQEVKFVLDSIIEFLEPLRLSGDDLAHAGQLLRDVESLRDKL